MNTFRPAFTPTILLIGTADTKADELLFLRQCIEDAGAAALIMDVGVLGAPPFEPALSRHAVAAAAGTSIDALAALGDENAAMTLMAAGAVALALEHAARGALHGVLALGGTLGTDLALDVAAALPLGLPKMLLSTVAFSHLIAPERLAPDLMMMQWAGGLYGLNSLCRTMLGQAAAAVVGACRSAPALPADAQPLVAISSLGKSCLSYMVRLKPALEARGYEVAVFHSTGIGGSALEALARQRRFAAVLDLCLQEVGNEVQGSVVSAGAERLQAAGEQGTPQIVAPGGLDMIDLQSWKPLPAAYAGRPYHVHNRLIGSVLMSADERRAAARVVAAKLARARGPVAFILPLRGIEAWDRPGQTLHEPVGLAAFSDEIRRCIKPPLRLVELDAHINDEAFTRCVLDIFDEWVRAGVIAPGVLAAHGVQQVPGAPHPAAAQTRTGART